ncbi:MAG: hypothetical protein J6A05_10120 [Oscillospiraceae bacterium]|nr:hypothetical protein [Oscillospiraceae bacterium]
MKAILKGYEPIDVVSSKTGKPFVGCTLHFDVKNKNVFGYTSKSELFVADTPIYKREIQPIIELLIDEDSPIYGAECMLDYNVYTRNGKQYSELLDFTITPPKGE